MSAAITALKIGALVRATCNSGCCCTETDNCGVSGKIGTLVTINEHNQDGDFYGVSFPGQDHVVYFWAHELTVFTSILVGNVQQADPICHRTGCPHTTPYNWATRRCTFEFVSESVLSLPFDHNGLFFSNRWITLDLCTSCYRHLKSDGLLRRLSTAIIVGKEASSGN